MSAADFRRFRLSHLRAAIRYRRTARQPYRDSGVWAGWAFAEAAQARYWREQERYQRRIAGGAA